ncbi:MAG: metallophosphoesterase [Candidatus Thorarchaeota archaeon]
MSLIENSLLQNLLNHPQKISKLKFNIISNILRTAKAVLEEEHLLLEFNLKQNSEDIYVIGDIHGNLDTFKKLLEIIDKNNPKLVIFLGDLVDRGPKQLECLLMVLILKILFPLKYYLLKGNHESLEMNQYYGFFHEFISKFKNENKFDEILDIYNVLPLCALVNNDILCLHGGIPQDIDILKKLKKQRCYDFNKIFKLNPKAIFQIMWNDPKSEIEGFSDSFRGPGIKFFGKKAFENFMEFNNLQYIIRAHECFPEGYRWFFNNHLLSIFSSANYRGYYSPNPASYAIIRDNLIIPKLLEL